MSHVINFLAAVTGEYFKEVKLTIDFCFLVLAILAYRKLDAILSAVGK